MIDSEIMAMIDSSPYIPNFRNMNNWACHRVCNHNLNFIYVRWVEKYIAFGYLNVGYDFVSTRFRGCRMARYINTQNEVYGCHIHCVARNHSDDRRNLWNQYVVSNRLNTTNSILFQPDTTLLYIAERQHPNLDFDLWGIIAQNGYCYSVIVYTACNYILTNYDIQFKAPVHLFSIKRHPKEPTMIIK